MRQFFQHLARVREGAARRSRVDNLLHHRRAGRALVNPQTAGLREKKPADNGGSNLPAPTIRPRRPQSPRDVLASPFLPSRAVAGTPDRRETLLATAVHAPPL